MLSILNGKVSQQAYFSELQYLYIMKSMARRTATARRLETTTAAISQLAVADPEDPALCIRGSAFGVYGSACGGEVQMYTVWRPVSRDILKYSTGHWADTAATVQSNW